MPSLTLDVPRHGIGALVAKRFWTDLTAHETQRALRTIALHDYQARIRSWLSSLGRRRRFSQRHWSNRVAIKTGHWPTGDGNIYGQEMQAFRDRIRPQHLLPVYDNRLQPHPDHGLTWWYSAFVSSVWVAPFERLPIHLYLRSDLVFEHLDELQEAYLTFVNRPLRRLLPEDQEAEQLALWLAVYEATASLLQEKPAHRPEFVEQIDSAGTYFKKYPQAREHLMTAVLDGCYHRTKALCSD